jgi:hypothetical protein
MRFRQYMKAEFRAKYIFSLNLLPLVFIAVSLGGCPDYYKPIEFYGIDNSRTKNLQVKLPQYDIRIDLKGDYISIPIHEAVWLGFNFEVYDNDRNLPILPRRENIEVYFNGEATAWSCPECDSAGISENDSLVVFSTGYVTFLDTLHKEILRKEGAFIKITLDSVFFRDGRPMKIPDIYARAPDLKLAQ